MKVYLVGGAVRDKLLGYPYQEKDWVVVGSSPQELLNLNYKQVGRDFPVFLHPQSGEEYALARKERKIGQGYYGFSCHFDKSIRLEEDLARRDITINAMAMDETGVLYDPYGGLDDLNSKIIRHVSNAFVEDPVRVLRVARFLARYHHLGFTLAPETEVLMRKMVFQGELQHLVPERIWKEWSLSLKERTPEQFLIILRRIGALKKIVPELDKLFGIPSAPFLFPQIDTGLHAIASLQSCVELTDDPVVRFAGFMFDLGKSTTPINQWPKHVNHEVEGERVLTTLCKRLKIPNVFLMLARQVCRYQNELFVEGSLNPKSVVSLLERVDAFKNPNHLNKLLLASSASLVGRMPPAVITKQMRFWHNAISVCKEVAVQPIIKDGFIGKDIKVELHRRRVERLKTVIKD